MTNFKVVKEFDGTYLLNEKDPSYKLIFGLGNDGLLYIKGSFGEYLNTGEWQSAYDTEIEMTVKDLTIISREFGKWLAFL